MSYDNSQIEQLVARIAASNTVKRTHNHCPANGYMQVVIIENGKLLLATVMNSNDRQRMYGSIKAVSAQTVQIIT